MADERAEFEEFEEREDDTVDDQPQPEVAKIRCKVRPSRDGRFRSKTIAPKRLTRDEKRLAQELVYPVDVARPRTREECLAMSVPALRELRASPVPGRESDSAPSS